MTTGQSKFTVHRYIICQNNFDYFVLFKVQPKWWLSFKYQCQQLLGILTFNSCFSAIRYKLTKEYRCTVCKLINSISYFVMIPLGGKYLFFVSSRSVKMRGFSFLSLYKSVFIFQFLNVKMYNYGKQNTIVNFIIEKLKKNTISSKSIKTKFSRRES